MLGIRHLGQGLSPAFRHKQPGAGPIGNQDVGSNWLHLRSPYPCCLKGWRLPIPATQALKISDEGANLFWAEPPLRHVRMAHDNSLAAPFQVLHMALGGDVAERQGARHADLRPPCRWHDSGRRISGRSHAPHRSLPRSEPSIRQAPTAPRPAPRKKSFFSWLPRRRFESMGRSIGAAVIASGAKQSRQYVFARLLLDRHGGQGHLAMTVRPMLRTDRILLAAGPSARPAGLCAASRSRGRRSCPR